MKKKWLILALILVMCLPLCVTAESAGDEQAHLAVHWEQSDPKWADHMVGHLSVADSGCGLASLCNALYYLNGYRADLVAVCDWAHEKGLLNPPGINGVYRSVYHHAGNAKGRNYGFTATEYRSGSIRTRELLAHLQNGGTAAIHVEGHFMAAVGYDPVTERVLVLDPLPGDVGKYDRRRKGVTHTGGDWLTFETLSQGYTKVDGYVLLSRAVTQSESDALVPAAMQGIHLADKRTEE